MPTALTRLPRSFWTRRRGTVCAATGVATAAIVLGIALTGGTSESTATSSGFLPHDRGIASFTELTTGTLPDGRLQHQLPLYTDLPERPSVVFPEGTTYPEAVTRYYTARELGRELPDGVEIGEPLPRGVVAQRADDGRLLIDSAAPLGFDPQSGRVREPTYTFPSTLSTSEIQARLREPRRLPRDAIVIVPPLPRCQVVVGSGDRPEVSVCEGEGLLPVPGL